MRVLILGAGVIGTTTAYYLAKAGAQVTVVDRQSGAANETSFANAGQISPGYSTPWAAPGIPLKALKWIFQKHAPLALRADGSLWQLQWLAQMLCNCTHDRYAVNKERMMRIAEYSRDALRLLRQETGIEYEQRMGGTLQLFRSDAQMDAVQRDIKVLQECGVAYELLDRFEIANAEPALKNAHTRLTGGLRLPGDETGDCYLFSTKLASMAAAMGVKFQFNQDIESVVTQGDAVDGILVGGTTMKADRYVIALGSFSRDMLLPLGLRLPVYPVKGYSLTVPLRDEALAPQSTVLDETYKIAITRLDRRIRVGGMAELSGFDMRLKQARRNTLEMVVSDLFPGGDVSKASFWTGLRPMTPDSTPIIGATRYRNLFLNTGHGTLGWTMACGSGRLIADMVTGQRPEINTEGLGLERYTNSARSNGTNAQSALV